MSGSQRGSVMGERRQSEVGSVVSHATANTTASRSAPVVRFAPLLTAYHPSTQLPPPPALINTSR